MATPVNRWAGTNKSGYTNPAADTLFDRLGGTIDPSERTRLHRQIVEEVIADVAIIPLFWEVEPIFALRGVRASLSGAKPTWNVHAWDKE